MVCRHRGRASRLGGLGAGGDGVVPGAVFGPETFVERVGDDALAPLAAAGDFAYVEPDEPAAHGWMVAVRADGAGGAPRVRRMAVESARSVPRAAPAAGPAWS